MAFPMNKREYDKWAEVRAKGKIAYAIKTSLTAVIVAFLIYFFGNAYSNLAHIDQYISDNMKQANLLALTMFIAFIVLFIVSLIIYSINDKRYRATTETDSGSLNA